MTPDERSTEQVRDWLNDAADEVGDPMRGMQEVIARVSTTSQQRRRRPWSRPAGTLVADRDAAGRDAADPRASHRRGSGRTWGLVLLAAAVGGAALVGTSLLVRRSEPRTFVVAQDGSGDATTIAGAVAMTMDGDEVIIRPGTYVEQVTVTKDIEIRGAGKRQEVTVQAPDGTGKATIGATGSVAFRYPGTSGSLANLSIIAGEDAIGILVEAAAAPDISNVGIESPGRGMYGTAAVQWSDGGSGRLHDSDVAGVLRMTGAGTAPLIDWNHLRGACIVVEADGGARDAQPQPVLRENEIDGCPSGVLVHVGTGSPVLERNGLSLPQGTAVSLTGVTGARIVDNAIHDSGTAIAIVNPRGPVTVMGNTVMGGAVGVSVFGNGDQVRLEGNQIRDSGIGINLIGGADPAIDGNLLCGNAQPIRGLPVGQERGSVEASEPCSEASPPPGA